MSEEQAAPGSGNRAIEDAAVRAETTGERNIPVLGGLPLPEDTANLRFGPNISDALLALLPLVGVWRGTGQHDCPRFGEHAFGQQLVIGHDGGDYLTFSSQAWSLDEAGEFVAPTHRESGFWRIGADDTIELLLTDAGGVVEMYYGKPRNQSSWELSTDVVIHSATGPAVGGAHRLYGIVDGGDLAYVEERVFDDEPMRPHVSARLARYAG